MESAGMIKTVVPIELPAQCTYGPKCLDTKNLASGSAFFIDGSKDIPISPPPWYIGEQSIEAYYNATPSSVEKVKGTLLGPGYNDIQGQPDCPKNGLLGCFHGVYGSFGHVPSPSSLRPG